MDALKADAANHTEELEMVRKKRYYAIIIIIISNTRDPPLQMYRRNDEVNARLKEAQEENLQLNEALATVCIVVTAIIIIHSSFFMHACMLLPHDTHDTSCCYRHHSIIHHQSSFNNASLYPPTHTTPYTGCA